jgi:hypothetical protein
MRSNAHLAYGVREGLVGRSGDAMLNAEQCLAKAAELERIARECDAETAVSYRRLAAHWRYLANGAISQGINAPAPPVPPVNT